MDFNESDILLSELRKLSVSNLNYSILLLALTTGLRYGELVGLTWDDFTFDYPSFENGMIEVNKTWGYMKKSEKGFGKTKNPQSLRKVSVDKVTMEHFYQLKVSAIENEHGLVFFSPSSKYNVISNTASNKLLKKTLQNLGLKVVSMHGLRHTHASVLLYKKISLYYVSERLGHGDIQTTSKEYTHVLSELRIEDQDQARKIFSGDN
ncbi:site-specific integrase [Salisediminibacterium selenitireducens]|uniref:site-specific integrase n=1 Tax=Salisediminibacterium selenitireducens TaxID=85683 RepID=UPI000674BE2E|nr:site-specific integrase [Salisediminibacterium selenitireducens]